MLSCADLQVAGLTEMHVRAIPFHNAPHLTRLILEGNATKLNLPWPQAKLLEIQSSGINKTFSAVNACNNLSQLVLSGLYEVMGGAVPAV
jgi:hypothetical protein